MNDAMVAPHVRCSGCRERLRNDPRADPAKPETFACGGLCLSKLTGVPAEEQPHFYDGGSRGRAAIDAKIPKATTARDVIVECAGKPGCDARVTFAAGTDATTIERHLDTHGWTSGNVATLRDSPTPGARPVFVNGRSRFVVEVPGPRHCGQKCASDNPRRESPPPASAPEVDEDTLLIQAFLTDTVNSVPSMNPLARGAWERRQAIYRGCVARRESVRAYAERVGRVALVRELRGEDDGPRQDAPEASEVREELAVPQAALAAPPVDRSTGQRAAIEPAPPVDRLGRQVRQPQPFRAR